MNRNSIIAATLLFPLLGSPAARAQQTCISIHFAQGQSSATVRGIASNDEPFACYTLTTQRGQTATLSIVKQSPKDDTAFTIPGVVDNQNQYTFKTEDKTYKPASAGWSGNFERFGDNSRIKFSILLMANRGGDGGPDG